MKPSPQPPPARGFVGFGFGAIQGGLFLREARRGGHFSRLTAAEILPDLVRAVRADGGRFRVNVATPAGVERETVEGVELLHPADPGDARRLVEAVAGASVLATALPSVDLYDRGESSPAALLARGLERRARRGEEWPCVIYAAENNNTAAERLEAATRRALAPGAAGLLDRSCRFLNTVIGKMSQILTDAKHIDAAGLARIAPGTDRAFLVEAFNRILAERCDLDPAPPGFDAFVEKDDLRPFEEAKLYGHNATHALVGYLALRKGFGALSEALADADLKEYARAAFLEESGAALVAKFSGADSLFTPEGFQAYADDLLDRMANPHLQDRVERIVRDPRRKLGWDDRLIGAIRLALGQGIRPARFARGAAAALDFAFGPLPEARAAENLASAWTDARPGPDERDAVIRIVLEARRALDP